MAKKAVQQIMLGTITKSESEAKNTLRAIKAAGYDGIELNSFMIHPTSMLVRFLTKAAGMPTGKGGKLDWEKLLKEANLEVTSLHIDLGSLERDIEGAIADAKRFDTKYLVITGMYRFDYSNKDSVIDLCNRLNVVGKNLKEQGISLLYHNHNYEFQKVDESHTAYDVIIENTNPDFVNFEFDSYWPTEAGVDVYSLMERLGDRVKLYHITDRGTRLEKMSITPILKSDCVELGYGNMNLEKLLQQALSVNVDAVVLESHKNWIEKSPLKSLQVSAKFLNNHI